MSRAAIVTTPRQEVIYEWHRHRFEMNDRSRQTLESAGVLLRG